MLASCFPKPKIADLLELNALYRRLRKQEVVIKIQPIPLERLTGLMFSDASLGNNADCSTHVCYLACCCDSKIQEGGPADVSVIAYKSHKMRRSASNVLYTESFAMSDGLAFGEWMATWIGLARDINYCMAERDTLNRQIQLTNIMTHAESDLPVLLSVTDSKSLFDNMIRE